jgi:hypothetical protein
MRSRVACAQSLCLLAIRNGEITPPDRSAQISVAARVAPMQRNRAHERPRPVCELFHWRNRRSNWRERQTLFLQLFRSNSAIWRSNCSQQLALATRVPSQRQQSACQATEAIRVPTCR